MATFAGASDALAATVAMQQALDRHNRSGTSDASPTSSAAPSSSWHNRYCS
jgi:hypothetical protein